MTLADPTPHTSAVVAALRSAGIVTGDADKPNERWGPQTRTPGGLFIPYAVVYYLEQSFDGTLGCPDDDSDFRWQVTCTGDTRQACDSLRHAVDVALIGQALTVAGRTVLRVRADGGAGTRRDDSTIPPVFISTPHYAAYSN